MNLRRKKLLLGLMFIALIVLSSAPVYAQNILTRASQTLYDLMRDWYVKFVVAFFLIFILLYGLFASALSRVKGWGGEGGKLPKTTKIVCVSLSMLSTFGIFGLNQGYSLEALVIKVLAPFGAFGALAIAIAIFMIIYFGFGSAGEDDKNWKLALLVAGLCLMYFGYLVSAPHITSIGWFIAFVGFLIFLIGSLIGMRGGGGDGHGGGGHGGGSEGGHGGGSGGGHGGSSGGGGHGGSSGNGGHGDGDHEDEGSGGDTKEKPKLSIDAPKDYTPPADPSKIMDEAIKGTVKIEGDTINKAKFGSTLVIGIISKDKYTGDYSRDVKNLAVPLSEATYQVANNKGSSLDFFIKPWKLGEVDGKVAITGYIPEGEYVIFAVLQPDSYPGAVSASHGIKINKPKAPETPEESSTSGGGAGGSAGGAGHSAGAAGGGSAGGSHGGGGPGTPGPTTTPPPSPDLALVIGNAPYELPAAVSDFPSPLGSGSHEPIKGGIKVLHGGKIEDGTGAARGDPRSGAGKFELMMEHESGSPVLDSRFIVTSVSADDEIVFNIYPVNLTTTSTGSLTMPMLFAPGNYKITAIVKVDGEATPLEKSVTIEINAAPGGSATSTASTSTPSSASTASSSGTGASGSSSSTPPPSSSTTPPSSTTSTPPPPPPSSPPSPSPSGAGSGAGVSGGSGFII